MASNGWPVWVLGWGVLAWPVAAGLAAHASSSEGDPAAPPRPDFRTVPGRAVGVIRLDCRDALAAEGRQAPEGAATFARDGASLRLFYVETEGKAGGKTLTFLSADATKPVRIPHLTLATAATLRRFGVRAPVTLVELVANEGAGCGPEAAFAASGIRPVDLRVREPGDATPRPLDEAVARLVRSVQTRAGDAASHQAEIRDARKRLPAYALTGGATEDAEETTTDVTWLSREKVVRVGVVKRFVRREVRRGQGIEPKRPPGVPYEAPAGQRFGVEYGVEIGSTYEITEDGRLTPGRPIGPRPFARQLDAPG